MKYAKAVVGAALAGLAALSTALPDGVTGQEWITIVIATLTSAGVVWAVPNAQGGSDKIASITRP